MKYLPVLTPAETLAVAKGNQATLRELLRATFLDLLRRQVVAVEKTRWRPGPLDPWQEYSYVRRGPAFNLADFHYHEQVFLTPFAKWPDGRILFRHLVKMGFEKAYSRKKYFALCSLQNRCAHFFSQNQVERWLGVYRYTAAGKIAQLEILEELRAMNDSLAVDSTVASLMQRIGGNVFLLAAAAPLLDTAYVREFEQHPLKSDVFATDGSSGGDSLGDHASAFDSSFSGFGDGDFGGGGASSDSGDGDGGDSGGDSGCGSGCGGGCGGGD